MKQKERKTGPNLNTHMSGTVDLEKTIQHDQPIVLEEPGQGPGIYDVRDEEGIMTRDWGEDE